MRNEFTRFTFSTAMIAVGDYRTRSKSSRGLKADFQNLGALMKLRKVLASA